jgi:hypothetical protein
MRTIGPEKLKSTRKLLNIKQIQICVKGGGVIYTCVYFGKNVLKSSY